MAHTSESITADVKAALKNPVTLYQQPFTKRAGYNQRFSEIAADVLLRSFNKGAYIITKVDRHEGYYISSHADLAKEKRPRKTNQKEKWDAREKFGHSFKDIGKIIDFETPLYTSEDKSVGAIDLLAYDEQSDTLTILEYKRKDNKEPLLRCVLEAYTYKTVVELNKDRFIKDFQVLIPKLSVDNTKINAAVFVYKGSRPYFHYNQSEDTKIRKLMNALNVSLIVID